MNEIIIRLKIIFLLGAVILSYQAVAQKVSKVHLKFVKVEAPFPMDSVRMCIFPDQDFPITQYGAKKGSILFNTRAFAKAIEACQKGYSSFWRVENRSYTFEKQCKSLFGRRSYY